MTYLVDSKQLLTRSEDKFMCYICRRRYRLPRILPCLHTFCSECISTLQTISIDEESNSQDVLESVNDLLLVCSNSIENFRSSLDIIRPPVEFESPDFIRSTLPRGRSGRSKHKVRTARSRSCCESLNIDEKCVRRTSRSLNRSTSSCSGRSDVKSTIRAALMSSRLSNLTVNYNASTGMIVTTGEDKRMVIECPKCWTVVQVSTTLNELPRNLIAERCVAEYSWNHPEPGLTCDLCSDTSNNIVEGHGGCSVNNIAISRCTNCADNMCSFCETAHKRHKKTKHHHLVRFETLFNSKYNCNQISTFPEYISEEVTTVEQCLFLDGSNISNYLTASKLPSLQKFQSLLWNEKQDFDANNEGTILFENVESTDNCQGGSYQRDTSKREHLQNNGSVLEKFVNPDQESDRAVKCLAHPDQVLKMFCVTCEMNICMDCAMSGHGDHDYQFVTKELFQNQMADVDRLIQTVIPRVKAVDDQLKSLADIKVTTNDSSVKVRDEVNDFMDTYVEAIEKHRKQLLTQIKSLVEDTERSVDATQLQLQQVRADVEQTCLFIGELLTSGTDVEILSLKKLLTHRLTSLHEVSRETQFKQHGVMRFCPTAKGDIINNFQMFGRVIVNQASAAESFLYGKGLTTSCVSKKSSMILTICDNNGVPYTGSDVTIETWIEFRGQKINVPVICKYKKGGVYMIELTPVSEGPHFLHVFVDGRSIKDSPFKFNVKGKWRNHTGTWQRPIHCFTTELKDQGGCNLGNISHTDVSFWSCCGKKIQGSSCSANSSRNSPVRQATF